MRKCLFCGNTNLSKEHIIPQWLLSELGIFDKDLSMTHFASVGIPLSNRQHVSNKLVNTLVCESCNNGWMSELEGQVKEHLKNLINTNIENVKDTINYIFSNPYVFAKWAFKTAILLNYPTNYRDIVPKEHFQLLYNGKIPEGTFIDIGVTKNGDRINWRQSQSMFIIRNSNDDMKNMINDLRKQYKITYQFRALMFRVCYLPYRYDEIYQDGKGAIGIHPQVGVYEEIKLYENIDEFDINHHFVKI